MTVQQAIENANALLPGSPLSNDDELDPRWQAIIEVENYVESNPKEVWQFIIRWGKSESEDVRTAIGTCLLEHLLEYHFSTYFPLVESLAATDPLFGDTFLSCWKFGQSEKPNNAKRFDRLKKRCRIVKGPMP